MQNSLELSDQREEIATDNYLQGFVYDGNIYSIEKGYQEYLIVEYVASGNKIELQSLNSSLGEPRILLISEDGIFIEFYPTTIQLENSSLEIEIFQYSLAGELIQILKNTIEDILILGAKPTYKGTQLARDPLGQYYLNIDFYQFDNSNIADPFSLTFTIDLEHSSFNLIKTVDPSLIETDLPKLQVIDNRMHLIHAEKISENNLKITVEELVTKNTEILPDSHSITIDIAKFRALDYIIPYGFDQFFFIDIIEFVNSDTSKINIFTTTGDLIYNLTLPGEIFSDKVLLHDQIIVLYGTSVNLANSQNRPILVTFDMETMNPRKLDLQDIEKYLDFSLRHVSIENDDLYLFTVTSNLRGKNYTTIKYTGAYTQNIMLSGINQQLQFNLAALMFSLLLAGYTFYLNRKTNPTNLDDPEYPNSNQNLV